MKSYLLVHAAALLALSSLSSRASEAEPSDESASAANKPKVSYEANVDYSFVGNAKTKLGTDGTGYVSEQSNLVHFVVSPQWNDGPLYRFGLELQRFSFGLSRRSALPNTLQTVSAIVGMDLQLFDSWLVRIEAQPGIYSDFHDLSSGDFNVPFLIGGSYIAGANLQWIVGLGVDVNREYPVIPAVGVRWSFLDRWVLNAVLPSPRLEFQWSKDLTLFLGADLKDGTFRVDGDFGKASRNSRLNNAVVEYDEVRVGGGAEWKLSPSMNLELESGYLPYRRFDFHRAGTHFQTDSGAPYGGVSVNAKF